MSACRLALGSSTPVAVLLDPCVELHAAGQCMLAALSLAQVVGTCFPATVMIVNGELLCSVVTFYSRKGSVSSKNCSSASNLTARVSIVASYCTLLLYCTLLYYHCGIGIIITTVLSHVHAQQSRQAVLLLQQVHLGIICPCVGARCVGQSISSSAMRSGDSMRAIKC